ncbi:unnamed protein product, partial [Angiostrongylus costaricensis]|uniref:S1 motif domain-containing protein n=1 Tax=Angiostrongylus costaricensis TaxID=334426 RepID=A0A0R3PH57_ANGCS
RSRPKPKGKSKPGSKAPKKGKKQDAKKGDKKKKKKEKKKKEQKKPGKDSEGNAGGGEEHAGVEPGGVFELADENDGPEDEKPETDTEAQNREEASKIEDETGTQGMKEVTELKKQARFRSGEINIKITSEKLKVGYVLDLQELERGERLSKKRTFCRVKRAIVTMFDSHI